MRRLLAGVVVALSSAGLGFAQEASQTPFSPLAIDPGLPLQTQELMRDVHGAGTANSPETLKLAVEPARPNDELLSIGVRHTKTGRFASRYSGGMLLGAFSIDAGTPVFVMVMSGGSSPGPIALWCAVSYSRPQTLERKGDRAMCFSRRPGGKAGMVTVTYRQSPYFPVSLTRLAENVGPWPDIQEIDTPMGVDLRRVFSLEVIKSDLLVVSVDVSDGRAKSRLATLRLKRDPDGSATLSAEGGKFRLTPTSDNTAVAVSQLESVKTLISYSDIQATPAQPSGYKMLTQAAQLTLDGNRWVSSAKTFEQFEAAQKSLIPASR